jgi:hypothetical protein
LISQVFPHRASDVELAAIFVMMAFSVLAGLAIWRPSVEIVDATGGAGRLLDDQDRATG